MKTELTVKEAIEEGYEYVGIAGRDYQSLIELNDIKEIDLLDHEQDWVLASKKSLSPKISPKDIAEMIADSMESDWGNDTGDDTEEVYNTVIKLNFEDTAKMINDSLSHKWCRMLTKIKLIL